MHKSFTEYPQPPVTCRKCGMSHNGTVCPLCKEPTPHLAVIRPLFTPHFKTIDGAKS